MEVQIAPETRAALEADTTMRFLYKATFNLDARHSERVITWAAGLAKAISCAMLKSIGREAAGLGTRLIMVQLLSIRHSSVSILALKNATSMPRSSIQFKLRYSRAECS